MEVSCNEVFWRYRLYQGDAKLASSLHRSDNGFAVKTVNGANELRRERTQEKGERTWSPSSLDFSAALLLGLTYE